MEMSHGLSEVYLFLTGSQPNIHPGSISSTGRQRVALATATSTQAAQLIGGGITPTLFTAQVSYKKRPDFVSSPWSAHDLIKYPRFS